MSMSKFAHQTKCLRCEIGFCDAKTTNQYLLQIPSAQLKIINLNR